MADLKRKHHRISKGDKVPVLIEEALDDVIIVTLKSGNKEFRGVLLDCSKRNIPHGVCFSSLPKTPDKSAEKGVNSTSNEAGENENGQISVSASTHRFTYNNDPVSLTDKVVLVHPKGSLRPVRSKAVRDIRLRPRQTLCSKCKNMIHENGKVSAVKSSSPKQSKPVTNITKPQLSPSRHLNRPMVTLKWGLRKRKYQQEETNENEVKKPAPAKSTSAKTRERPERQTRSSVDNKIAQAKESFPEVRLYKLEDVRNETKAAQSGAQNVESRSQREAELPEQSDEVDSATLKTQVQSDCGTKALNPKATPIIKISFGDGAVLKIPPRLPGAEIDDHVESSSEEIQEKHVDPPVENRNYVMHKKLKKAMKKSKERVRNKSGDHENRAQSLDEKSDKHHRKHKRKHKHRHLSPYESRPLESNTNVIINDWNANEEKDLKETFDKDSLDKESLEMENKSISDWVDQISNGEDEDNENSVPTQEEVRHPRPRLLYTWNNNRGLSRVEASPKEFRFSPEQRFPSEERFPPEEIIHQDDRFPPEERFPVEENFPEENFVPEQRFPPEEHFPEVEQFPVEQRFPNPEPSLTYEDSPPPMIVGVGPYSPISSASEPSDDPTDLHDGLSYGPPGLGTMMGELSVEEPQTDSDVKNMKPLMMKIQTQTVVKCVTETGRQLHVGDIVWGKIQGFPWWPGRILSITVTQKDSGVVIAQIAHVTWFGSSTMSHMQCSELFPFLEDFKLRFNKKKRGPYRIAIKQATMAAQSNYSNSGHHIDLEDLDEYKSS
ncbi:uncharacterized protein LOC124139419 [Haliotis rufescens]|uniref:uncharacterized protein LOC124139419 n=1 Tax=Haliotis rufescens TaxID=6454 RepID=UPI00201F4C7E|nr:uncharacterized protein LOC124139419 [Haliotis rufescens]